MLDRATASPLPMLDWLVGPACMQPLPSFWLHRHAWHMSGDITDSAGGSPSCQAGDMTLAAHRKQRQIRALAVWRPRGCGRLWQGS